MDVTLRESAGLRARRGSEALAASGERKGREAPPATRIWRAKPVTTPRRASAGSLTQPTRSAPCPDVGLTRRLREGGPSRYPFGWRMGTEPTESPPRKIGRYALHGEIASGGMATVHFGRLLGPVGFSRTVAIKRLHPQYAKDPEFVSMFLDEARVAARILHPNVIPTLDV